MEERMRLYRMGIVLLIAVLSMMVSPAWSQDAATAEETSTETQVEASPAEVSAEPSTEAPVEAPPAEASEEASEEVPAEASPAVTSSPQADSVVQIEDAVVCQDVVDRAPVGAGDLFVKETAKIYCFCRVVGAQAGSRITHNWYFNGVLKASVKLEVRSTNFRTWSSKTLQPGWLGEWMVEILSDDGKPLESIVFMVQ
jgi:hypothetical protein